jgi:hypothetical protein
MGGVPYLSWSGHHHVHVEEGVRQLGLQTLDDGMAEGEVRHKLTVHHVQVEVVSTGIQQPPSENHRAFSVRSSGWDPDTVYRPYRYCVFSTTRRQCCGTVTFLYGTGSHFCSVTVPAPTFDKLRFRFRFRFRLRI